MTQEEELISLRERVALLEADRDAERERIRQFAAEREVSEALYREREAGRQVARFERDLHSDQRHPDYEYCVTVRSDDAQPVLDPMPTGEGWEPNTFRLTTVGLNYSPTYCNWKRLDRSMAYYWRRKKRVEGQP